MATLTALAAAFFFGSAHILVRYGMRTGSTTTAITFNIITMGTVLLAVMGPWAEWTQASVPAVGWFMLAGAVAPLTTQFLFYAAISRVGVARASPLRNTSPLFAGVVAVAWLGEQWTLPLAGGTVLIILGATILGMRDARALTAFRKRDLLFAIAASILGGIASPIRKFGYSMITSVPLAVCLTIMGSVGGLLVYLTAARGYRDVNLNRGAVMWFGLSGMVTSCGITSYMLALSRGDVVLVDPLIATTPLFSVAFTHLLLKDQERVTSKAIIGALLICAGGVVLTAF